MDYNNRVVVPTQENRQAGQLLIYYADVLLPLSEPEFRTIFSQLSPRTRPLDRRLTVGNPGADTIIQRIRRLEREWPRWAADIIDASLGGALRTWYPNPPDLLRLILEWAMKWAAVRFRTTTSHSNDFPREHIQGFFEREDWHNGQTLEQSTINHALIHDANPEEDALMSLVSWYSQPNNANWLPNRRPIAIAGREPLERAGWRYFLNYKMSPADMRRILLARDNLNIEGHRVKDINRFLTWTVHYLRSCANFQRLLGEAIGKTLQSIQTQAGRTAYRGEYGPSVSELMKTHRDVIRTLRIMLARAGLFGDRPNYRETRLYDKDWDAFKAAVVAHNAAGLAITPAAIRLDPALLRRDMYDDVSWMLTRFPGVQPTTPADLPPELIHSVEGKLPFGFMERGDLGMVGLDRFDLDNPPLPPAYRDDGNNGGGGGNNGGGGGGGGGGGRRRRRRRRK
ncbi:uncharacterized protein PG986_000211 [Apiospora aurea]|uniref:Uncharacterized protein n=1 Tax=Apiospora aurea TaxID=335848 RepID=A0ABR1QTE9_9PEZI